MVPIKTQLLEYCYMRCKESGLPYSEAKQSDILIWLIAAILIIIKGRANGGSSQHRPACRASKS
jgi:hypothetical protein